jgi:hypothetical protein
MEPMGMRAAQITKIGHGMKYQYTAHGTVVMLGPDPEQHILTRIGNRLALVLPFGGL